MPTPGKSPVIPTMRYRDARAAIDWLCRVLGFSPHLVVPDEDGTIAHAQLTLGDTAGLGGALRPRRNAGAADDENDAERSPHRVTVRFWYLGSRQD